MNEPTTRNTIEEQAKRLAAEMLKSIGNDTDWRTQQALTWARIEAKQDHFQFVLDQHMRDDRAEFLEIKEAARGVSSSVSEMERTESEIKGARSIAGWLGAGMMVIVGVLVWLGTRLIEAVARGQP